MLDLSTLRVNDRVRLRCSISGQNAGTVGTVVKIMTAHETDGKEVPAVIVVWDPPLKRSTKPRKEVRDAFTQHEQALHWILERAEETGLPQGIKGMY